MRKGAEIIREVARNLWRQGRLPYILESAEVLHMKPEFEYHHPLFEFHADYHVLLMGEKKILLSPHETKLLKILAQHPNTPVKYDNLGRELWGGNKLKTDIPGYTKVLVRHIKNKMNEVQEGVTIIENIRGEGYRLLDPSKPDPLKFD